MYQKGLLWNEKRKKYQQNPLPKIVHPYHQNISLRRRNAWSFFFMVTVVGGIYSFLFFKESARQNDLVSVYVAKRDLEAPVLLTEEELSLEFFPRKKLPEGFFTSWKEDQVLVHDVGIREILTLRDVQSSVDPKSVSTRFKDFFALSLDEDWFEATFPHIYPGDHIDIVSGNPGGATVGTSILVEYGEVLDIQTARGKKSITLHLTKAQAQSLLFARSLRLPLQILVYPSDYIPVKSFVPAEKREGGKGSDEIIFNENDI